MKRNLLKHFLLFGICLFLVRPCCAIGPITSANQQLRNLFQYTTNPSPDILFLYELGAHIIDSAFYDRNCTLTTNADIWFYAYKELGWCAYDTTWMESDSSVYARACDVYADTITIGIMDWQYQTLSGSALTSDYYFSFDTINNRLNSTNQNQSGAYNKGEIFMSSPLIAASQTNMPIFKVSPSFVFTSSDFWSEYEHDYDCYIDFDDGQGPQQVNLSATSYYPVRYNTTGYHVLKTTIRDRNDTTSIFKSSNSGFVVGSAPALAPSDFMDMSDFFPGLKVYQFNPECNNGLTGDDKIIFILSGYNPRSFYKNNIRSSSALYEKYIVKGHREILRQFGYTFVIVEWEDANDTISANARRVMNLLEYYKCHMNGQEQFVLIGESMGALVGRYALTYMESPYYHSPNDCRLNLKHNVRLFISNDGPHLGANIPLSIQELVSAFASEYYEIRDLLNISTEANLDFANKALNGPSVKQMLLYHYSTEDEERYYPHRDHYLFLDEIESIGGFPRLCKNVALSNGSLSGYNQQKCYSSLNAGSFRTPNDNMLDVKTNLKFHIFGFNFDTNTDFVLKTNPNGFGPLLSYHVSASYPIIKLYWFGIRIEQNGITIADSTKDGRDLIPYCTSAGGAIWLTQSGYGGYFPNLNIGSFLLGFNISSSAGYFSLDFTYGIPWLIGGSTGVTLGTDGLGFCLVPVQSAFCYDPSNWNLNRDYTLLSTSTIFNNTFFDVLYGIPFKDDSYRYNGLHENYRNTVFVNQITHDTVYYYCDKIESRILNREIGDEELFLDNSMIYDTASYFALLDIYINEPHPYYNFDGQISTIFKVPGMYCRTEPFYTMGTYGYALLKPGGVVHNGFPAINYEKVDVSLYPCCSTEPDILPSPSIDVYHEEDSIPNTQCSISPNPVGLGENVRIVSSCVITSVELHDIMGNYVTEISVNNENDEFWVSIPSSIPTGLYNVSVICENTVYFSKLYIY